MLDLTKEKKMKERIGMSVKPLDHSSYFIFETLLVTVLEGKYFWHLDPLLPFAPTWTGPKNYKFYDPNGPKQYYQSETSKV